MYAEDDEEEETYCPHVDIRSILPIRGSESINKEDSPGSISPRDESPNFGTPGEIEETDLVSEGDVSRAEVKKVKKRVVVPKTCSACKTQGQVGKGKVLHFWRCVDTRCGLILCGSAGDNHASKHFMENPDHAVQENMNTHRLWCGICEREVFCDVRNRRRAPGVWVPPNSLDFTNDPPRGLCNIGNTCFMNAALQNIVAIAPLTAYIMGDTCSLLGKNVAGSYRWLLTELISEPQRTYRNGVMPSRLLHAVRASHPIFRGFQQHDAQEFLRLFMDSLANETKVPHFVLKQDEDKKNEDSENESDTESFETCDSGNGSEEAVQVDCQHSEAADGDTLRLIAKQSVKVVMKSCLSDIFDGEIESSVQCLSCHQISRRVEVFQDLSLPIPTRDELATLKHSTDRYEDSGEFPSEPGWMSWFWSLVKSFLWGPQPSLDDCFRAFFSSDELKGKNMYFCEKCGKLRNGIKRCSLNRLPEVLCVHLKRFRMYEYSGGMGYSGKISQYVQFPAEGLDVRPFVHPDCPDNVSDYRLTGVICHMGSVMGGHYTAYVKKGDQWYLADDSSVMAVPWDTVSECEAYVLFYQKSGFDDGSKTNALIQAWTDVDLGRLKANEYHIVSRKWLTKLFWCDDRIPLDNSDVVCPHGYLVPSEDVNLRATWIPSIVWNKLVESCPGGPDLKHPGDCSVCTTAWKKFQQKARKPSTSRKPSIMEAVNSAFNSSASPLNVSPKPKIHDYYRNHTTNNGYGPVSASSQNTQDDDDY